MLRQRVITAVILIPLVVAFILYAPPVAFFSVTGLIAAWAAWEWSALLQLKFISHRLLYLIFVCLVAMLTIWVAAYLGSMFYMLIVAFAWWLIAAILIFLYPRAQNLWAPGNIRRALIGCLVIVPCWLALNSLRGMEGGPQQLLFLCILVWGADTSAYFVGRRWGKHLLAPEVSPKKTWEGVAGALICTFLIADVYIQLQGVSMSQWFKSMMIVLITVIFSIVGDLLESMMKRQAGVKDSGQLLPGHGGLLDRIDSLTAAVPIFLLGVLVL